MRRAAGALLLPRKVADHGTASWPKCAICLRNVDAYGIENETDASIEIWARCDGVRIDPKTGKTIGFAVRMHEPMKSSVTILKGPGWSPQRFTDIVRRQAFFAPAGEGERRVMQTITAQGVTGQRMPFRIGGT